MGKPLQHPFLSIPPLPPPHHLPQSAQLHHTTHQQPRQHHSAGWSCEISSRGRQRPASLWMQFVVAWDLLSKIAILPRFPPPNNPPRLCRRVYWGHPKVLPGPHTTNCINKGAAAIVTAPRIFSAKLGGSCPPNLASRTRFQSTLTFKTSDTAAD
jgi:hypothetical protein